MVRWCGGAVVRWCGGAVVRWCGVGGAPRVLLLSKVPATDESHCSTSHIVQS